MTLPKNYKNTIGKNKIQYYSIADAAFKLQVSQHTLRNWEREGKITPSYKTEQGHRRYTDADIEKLLKIQKNLDSIVNKVSLFPYRGGVGGGSRVEHGMTTKESGMTAQSYVIPAKATRLPDGQGIQAGRTWIPHQVRDDRTGVRDDRTESGNDGEKVLKQVQGDNAVIASEKSPLSAGSRSAGQSMKIAAVADSLAMTKQERGSRGLVIRMPHMLMATTALAGLFFIIVITKYGIAGVQNTVANLVPNELMEVLGLSDVAARNAQPVIARNAVTKQSTKIASPAKRDRNDDKATYSRNDDTRVQGDKAQVRDDGAETRSLLDQGDSLKGGSVLGEETNLTRNITFNIDAVFKKGFKTEGIATFGANLVARGQNLDLGTGKITASNIIQTITAGEGVAISGETQKPIITNTGVLTLQGEAGDIELEPGDGIEISGLSIASIATLEDVVALGGCVGCVMDADVSDILTISALGIVSGTAITSGTVITTVGGTGLISYTTGDILYASATNVLSKLPIGAANKVLTVSAGGIPSWSTPTVKVQESDATVTFPTETFDFLGGDFDLSESPSEEVNIQLASILTSVTGVAGNFTAIGGNLYVGANETTNGVITLYSAGAGITDPTISTNSLGNVLIPNGNVGIGTTAPAYKLDVNGTGRFVSGVTLDSTLGVTGTTTLSGALDSNGNVNFADTNIEFDGASTTFTTTGAFTLTPGGSVLIGDGGDTLQISASSAFFTGGNVGIGTTAPSSELEIYSTDSALSGVKFSSSTAGTNYSIGVGDGTPFNDALVFLAGSSQYAFMNASGNWGFGFAGTAGSRLSVSGGVSIGSSYVSTAAPTNGAIIQGNVGIGTTAPQNPLHVVGGAFFPLTSTAYLGFGNGATSTVPNYVFYHGTGSSGANILRLRADAVNASNFEFLSFQPTTGRVFATNGVTIGAPSSAETASGMDTLHVEGSISLNGAIEYGQYNATKNTILNVASSTVQLGNTGDVYDVGIYANSSAPRLFISRSTGNVGIGTTAPATALEIGGSGNLRIGGLTASSGVYTDVNKTLTSTAPSSGILGYWQRNGTNLAPSNIGDNVGIGTTAPAYKLDVSGTINASGALSAATLTDGTTTFADTAWTSTSAVAWDLATSTTALNIETGLLNLDTSNGRVGIGTTAPTYKTDIVSTTTTGALNLTADSVTTGTAFNMSFDGLTTGNGMYLESTSTALSSGNLASLYWNPASATTATGDLLRLNVGANGVLGNIFNVLDNGSSVFSVSQTGITNNLPTSFTSAGDVSMAYDLNFTNPTASYIKSSAPLYLQAGETFNSSDLTLQTYNSGQVVLDSAGGVVLIQAQPWTLATSTTALNISSGLLNLDTTNTRVGIGNTAPANLLTVTGSADITGNLGIGTTAPANALEIGGSGNLRIGGLTASSGVYTDVNKTLTSTAPSSGILGYWQRNGTSLAPSNIGDNVGIGTTAPVSLFDVNSKFNVLSGGNVGIGTTAPTALLHLGIGSTALIGQKIVLASGATANAFEVNSSSGVGGDKFLIKADGNVGIGTTNPLYKLEVNGTANIAGALTTTGNIVPNTDNNYDLGTTALRWKTLHVGPGSVVVHNDATDTLKATLGFTGSIASLLTDASTALWFATGANQGIFVGTTGNVGVGTTSPSANLHVIGQCVTGDTLLKRKRKRRRADGTEEEYFEDVPIVDIKEGDEIQTLDEKTGRMTVSKVNRLMEMGDKELYKLTTVTGKTIRTTGNHPYLVAPKNVENTRTAVFIDAANLEISAKFSHYKFDYKDIVSHFEAKGSSAVIRYYSVDFQNAKQRKFFGYIDSLGIKIITKPIKIIKKEGDEKDKNKANFDVEISFDSAIRKDDFDTAVLFSGDSDFTYMVSQLQKKGKNVVVVSPWRTTGRELRDAASLYLDLNSMPFVKRDEAEENKNRPRRASQNRFINGMPILKQIAPFVNGGVWTKVSDIAEGAMIATTGTNGKPVFERVVSIERMPVEQVFDIEVEGTHNFVGNGIVAHNTYLKGSGTTTGFSLRTADSAGADKFAVLDSGNVGIGTTAPANALEIGGSGNLRVGGLTASSGVYTDVNKTLTSTAPSSGILGYWQRNGTSLAPSNIGDNVGIGTTAPVSLFDVNSKFNVLSGGNVGIGTTSPLRRFDIRTSDTTAYSSTSIAGDGAYIYNLNNSGTSGLFTTLTFRTSSDNASSNALGAINLIQVDNGSHQSTFAFQLRAAGGSYTEPMRIMSTGNIGIGTTAPLAKLDVGGTIFFDNLAALPTDKDTYVGLIRTEGSGAFPFDNAGSLIYRTRVSATAGRSSHLFYTGSPSTEKVRINELGNVGIGTTAPLDKLQVAGDITPATFNVYSLGNSSRSWMNVYSQNYILHDGGGADRATLTSSAPDQLLIGAGFTTVALTNTGNVGIGTTNPLYKLEVNGTTNIVGALTTTGSIIPNTNDTYDLGSDALRWANIYLGPETLHIGTSTSDEGYLSYITANNVLNMQSTGNIALQPTSGNVGIGTTNPTQKLHVSGGNILIDNNRALYAKDTGGTARILLLAGGDNSLSYGTLGGGYIFWDMGTINALGKVTETGSWWLGGTTALTAPKIVIQSTGNVGIGTTNPLRIFQIGANLFSVETTTGYIAMANSYLAKYSSGNLQLGPDSGWSSMSLYTGGAEKVRIDSSGNVGIGTTGPGAKLDVTGPIAISGSPGSPGATLRYIGAGGTVDDLWFNVPTGGEHRFAVNDIEIAQIDANAFQSDGVINIDGTGNSYILGNVGIGTTGPDTKLTVGQDGGAIGGMGQFAIEGATDPLKMLHMGIDTTANIGWIEAARYGNAFYSLALNPYGGNVGIGTTAPGTKLDVVGQIRTNTNGLFINTGLGYDIAGIWSPSSQVLQLGGQNINDVLLATGFGTAVTIKGSSGNVGIGTTGPAQKLHVVGNTRFDGLTYFNDANGLDGTKWGVYGWDDGLDFTKRDASWNYVSVPLRLKDNGDVLMLAGNVGIGTTAPGQTLDIQAALGTLNLQSTTTTNRAFAQITNTNAKLNLGVEGSAGGVVVTGSSAYSSFVSATNNTLHFGDTGTVRMTIKDGNVGIGTTNPLFKLEVNGTTNIAGALTTTGSIIPNTNDTYDLGSDALRWANIYLGPETLHIGTSTSDEGYLSYITANNVLNMQSTGNIALQPTSGNVGIGTTGPGAKLHVLQDTGEAIRIGTTNGATTGALSFANSNVQIFRNSNAMRLDSYSGWMFYDTQGTAERVRITNDGNLGIGTTAPTGFLEILGTNAKYNLIARNDASDASYPYTSTYPELAIRNLDTTAGNSSRITFQTNSSTPALAGPAAITAIFTDHTAGSLDADLAFFTSLNGSYTENLRLKGGNVGIGLTGPNTKLDVNGAVNASATSGFSLGITGALPNGTGGFYHTDGATTGQLFLYANLGGIKFGVEGATSAMTILKTSGNVGIGTTSPTLKLDVIGRGVFRSAGLGDVEVNDTDSTGDLRMTVAGTDGRLNLVNSGTLTFRTNNLDRVGIDSAGNVGIGTTAPTQALEVFNATNANHLRLSGAQVSGIRLMTTTGNANNRAYSLTNNTADYGDFVIRQSTSNTADPYGGNYVLSINKDGDVGLGGQSATTSPNLYVKGTGNVGIGTTNPLYKLEVNGTTNIAGALTTTGSIIPNTNDTYDLGSDALRWANIYLGPETLHIGTSTSDEGYLSYITANNVLNMQSTGNIALQPTSGNVGIGTTSPTGKLQVSSADGSYIFSLNGATKGIRFGTNSSTSLIEGVDNTLSGSYQPLFINGSFINFGNSGAEYMRITGGNVGIGTTGPGAALHIVNTTLPQFRIAYNATNYLDVSNNGVFNLVSVNTNDFDFKQEGTSRMIIKNTSGNVGIGTTGPGAKLSVLGSVHLRESTYYSLNLQTAYSWGGEASLLHNAYTVDNTGSGAKTYKWSDTHASFGSRGIEFDYATRGISFFADRAATTADATFTPTERMTITNEGNVGIGTTNPLYKLEVNGTTNIAGALTTTGSIIPNTNDTYDLGSDALRWANIYLGPETLHIGTSTSDEGYLSYITANNVLNMQSTGNIALQPTSGNVGIGTTNPGTKLEIGKDADTSGNWIRIKSDTGSLNLISHGSTDGGNNAGIIQGLKIYATGNYPMVISHNAAQPIVFGTNDAERMRILSGGNVGIGTTGPGYKLDVSGTGRFTGNVLVPYGGATAASLIVGDAAYGLSADSDILYLRASQGFRFRNSANTDYVTIQNGGNVGIGTTAPATKLDVDGGITINLANSSDNASPAITLNVADDFLYNGVYLSQYGFGFHDPALGSWNGSYIAGYSGVDLFTSGLNRLSITEGGNVGIGTTAPLGKLQVGNYVNTAVNFAVLAGTPGAPATSGATQTNGSLRIGTNTSNSQALDIGLFNASPYGAWLQATNSGDLSSNSILVLNPNGGSVGIGTTTPAGNLEIYGTDNSQRLYLNGLNDGTANSNQKIGFYQAGTLQGLIGIAGAAEQITPGSVTGDLIIRGDTQKILFTTDGGSTSSMVINTSGNVGIGTTGPNHKLDVLGNIRVSQGNQIGFNYWDEATLYRRLREDGTDLNIENSAGGITFGTTTGVSTATELARIVTAVGATQGNVYLAETLGNVGIGTTGPGAKLHVYNAANVDPSLVAGTFQPFTLYSGGADISMGNAASSPNYAWIQARTAGVAWPLTINPLGGGVAVGYSDPGTATLAINGNVGIGTTSPGAKLDVNGEFQSLYGVRIGTATNGTTGQFLIASSQTYLDYIGDLHIRTAAASAEKVTILGTGNVGIGTTAPDTKLNIVAGGNAIHTKGTATGSFSGILVSSVDSNYIQALSWGAGSAGTRQGVIAANLNELSAGGGALWVGTESNYPVHFGINGAPKVTIDTSGNVGIGTTAPGGKLDVRGDIYFASDATGYLNRVGNFVRMTSTSASYGLQLLVDSTVTKGITIDTTGNVGIGTTAPNEKLEVQGNARIGGTLIFDTAGTVWPTLSRESTYGGLVLDTTGGSVNAAGELLSIRNNTGTKVTVLGNGNVGIGTTAPGSIFEVSSGASFTAFKTTNADTNSLVKIINDAQTWQLGNRGSDLSDAFVIRDETGGVDAVTVLKSSGNVGIGTTAPGSKLTVVGQIDANTTATTEQLHVTNGTTFGFFGASGSNGYAKIGAYDSGTGYRPFIIQPDGGNVGIGTTNPLFKLEVNGTTNIAGALTTTGNIIPNTNDTYDLGSDALRWANIYLGPETLHIGTSTSDEGYLSYITANNVLNMQSTGNIALQPTSGNVGIGTTGPGALLDVSGGDIRLATNAKNIIGVQTNAVAVSMLGMSSSNVVTLRGGAGGLRMEDDGSNLGVFVQDGGNVGVGTTAPTYKLDVVSTSTTGALNLTADSVTTGTALNMSFDGLSTGNGMYVESTSTALSSGNLASLYWNPGSSTTATGDLLRLNVGANGVLGNLLNILDNGSSVFSVSQTAITNGLPVNFTSAGDVAMAYDLNFTNPTASYIKSSAPLYLQAGETFNSSDLTLQVFNQGSVVIDKPFSGSAITDYGINLTSTDATSSANTDYTIYSNLALSGNAAKIGVNYFGTQSSSSTTADTLIGVDLASSTTGVITTGTRSVYGVRSQPTSTAASTGGTTNVYGAYVKPSGVVGAGGTLNAYGLYVANGTFDTTGTSANYGLWVEAPTGADVNYAAIFAGGNVGVGTTAPAKQLDIYAAAGNPGLRITRGSATLDIFGSNPYFALDTSTGYNLALNPSGNGVIGVGGYTAGTGAMIINGNVGIGTTAPGYKLDVNGGVNVGGGNWLTFAGVNTLYSSAGVGFFLQQPDASTPTTFRSNLGANQVTISTAGNVGIGTTAPSARLQVVDTVNDPQITIGNGTRDVYIQGFTSANASAQRLIGMQNNSNVNDIWVGSSATSASRLWVTGGGNVGIGTINPGTAGLAVMNGNVGIGTTGPRNKLDIAGTGETGQPTVSFSYYSSSFVDRATTLELFKSNSNTLGTLAVTTDGTQLGSIVFSGVNTNSAGDAGAMIQGFQEGAAGAVRVPGQLRFLTNAGAGNVERVRITSSGNVGIGTTAPGYQLQLSTDSAAKPTSNTWTIASDARLKENIQAFGDGLSIINQINPVSYDLNGQAGMPKGAHGIGILAQDVKDIIPYTISTFKGSLNGEETELYSFNSSALTFVTINAIKELDTKLTEAGSVGVSMERVLKQVQDDMLGVQGNILGVQDANTVMLNSVQHLQNVLGVQDAAVEEVSVYEKIKRLEERVGVLEASSSVIASETKQSSASASLDSSSSTQNDDGTASLQSQIDSLKGLVDLLVRETSPSAETSASAVMPDSDPASSLDSSVRWNDVMVNNTLKVLGDVSVLGTTTLTNTNILGKLTVGTLTVSDVDASINVLAGSLKLQNENFGDVEIFGKEIVFTKGGNAVFGGEVLAKKVKAEEFTVSGSESAGSAVIKAGEGSVKISSKVMKAGSKVFVTATSATGGYTLFVSEKVGYDAAVDGSGYFMVSVDDGVDGVSAVAGKDIKFDWFVVGVE